jgi:hypothetical protein
MQQTKSRGSRWEKCANWIGWSVWLSMPYGLIACISYTCFYFQFPKSYLHRSLPCDPLHRHVWLILISLEDPLSDYAYVHEQLPAFHKICVYSWQIKDYMVTEWWTWHGKIKIINSIYLSKASIYSLSTYCSLHTWQRGNNSLPSNSSNLCSVRS